MLSDLIIDKSFYLTAKPLWCFTYKIVILRCLMQLDLCTKFSTKTQIIFPNTWKSLTLASSLKSWFWFNYLFRSVTSLYVARPWRSVGVHSLKVQLGLRSITMALAARGRHRRPLTASVASGRTWRELLHVELTVGQPEQPASETNYCFFFRLDATIELYSKQKSLKLYVLWLEIQMLIE